jgi:DMSO reductase anchor subunit
MHPALSIILFTSLSGLGFGLLAWLGLGNVPESARFGATVLGFVLTSAGLSASTFHLGHPERAWRALSQWRSSWLSREGVMAILTLFLVAAWWWLDYPRWLGFLLSFCAMITVYTTSMIYAQMRSVAQWNTGLTPAVFMLFSLVGGGLLMLLCSAMAHDIPVLESALIAALLVIAWSVKLLWWRRADDGVEISDPASATGLGDKGQVRLLESPHSGSNYLLKEMGFRVGRKHADTLRKIALLAGGVLPLAALLIPTVMETGGVVALAATVLLHFTGVLAERWLFFAQARHAVMSFYE